MIVPMFSDIYYVNHHRFSFQNVDNPVVSSIFATFHDLLSKMIFKNLAKTIPLMRSRPSYNLIELISSGLEAHDELVIIFLA